MARVRYRKAPPVGRGILIGLALALLVALSVSGGDPRKFAVSFAIAGALDVGFYVLWARWNTRPRRVRFDVVWLGFVIAGGATFFILLLALGRSLGFAALASLGPTFFVVFSWLILRSRMSDES